jgi:hypothetical protein
MTMPDMGANMPEPSQVRWFRALEQGVLEDHIRLHRDAPDDPQRAGHGGESTWVRVLEHWLPSAYQVVTRKYILPEIGNKKFETDIVVLHPSYPEPLRSQEEILAGGVAAAFNVKLTLDSAGIRDGIGRAVALRRALEQRNGTPRREMVPPFPVGILAHSHNWKAPASTPIENISSRLWSLENELVGHPRETLDYLCVADLAMWSTLRRPYAQRHEFDRNEDKQRQDEPVALLAMGHTRTGESSISALINNLYIRLSYFDPTLRPLAESLQLTNALGKPTGPIRLWDLGAVFSEPVLNQLPQSLRVLDPEWSKYFY